MSALGRKRTFAFNVRNGWKADALWSFEAHCQEVQSIAHNLSGTAAIFEAKELGRIAAQTEEALNLLTPDAGAGSYDAAENMVGQFSGSLRAYLAPLAA